MQVDCSKIDGHGLPLKKATQYLPLKSVFSIENSYLMDTFEVNIYYWKC